MIDGFDTAGVIVVHLWALLPAVVAVARAVGFPSGAKLDDWMRGHGLVSSEPGRTLVAAYLRRVRWVRTVGFLLGWSILPLGWLWYTRSAYRMNEWPTITVLAGVFALSVVLAEVVRPKLEGGSVVASETRDRLVYVPGFTRSDPLWFGVCLAGIVVAAVAVGANLLVPVGLLTGALSVWTASVGVQRWILGRPQRGSSIEMLRVDDALRSVGATGVAGLGYGASILSVGAGLVFLGAEVSNGSGFLLIMGTLIAVFGVGIAIGFLSLSNQWIVPRLRRES